jgi:hypothetical protein
MSVIELTERVILNESHSKISYFSISIPDFGGLTGPSKLQTFAKTFASNMLCNIFMKDQGFQ